MPNVPHDSSCALHARRLTVSPSMRLVQPFAAHSNPVSWSAAPILCSLEPPRILRRCARSDSYRPHGPGGTIVHWLTSWVVQQRAIPTGADVAAVVSRALTAPAAVPTKEADAAAPEAASAPAAKKGGGKLTRPVIGVFRNRTDGQLRSWIYELSFASIPVPGHVWL